MRKPGIPTSAILGISSIFLASPLWAQGPAWNGGVPCSSHMMGWGGGWSGMIFGPLMMILVLALPVAAVVVLIRWLGGSRGRVGPGQTPLDILRERYARGEIDKEEFEERRRTLGD